MSDGEQQPPSPPLPEEEHFQIALSLDKDDRDLFRREYAMPRVGCGVMLLIVGISVVIGVALFIGVAALLRAQGGDGGFVPFLIALAVMVAITQACRHLVIYFGRHPGAIDTDGWLLITTSDGLWLQTRTRSAARVHPWSAFTRMIVSDAAIYLGLDGKRVIMLPARVVGDRNDFYTFVSVMAKYAGV